MGGLRVLLVGAGRAGMVHGRNLAKGIPGARLVGVADPSEEARRRAAAELEIGFSSPDPVEAATSDGIDAVVIGSPTFTHADVAVPALQAGKHVLCEKPLASNVEDGLRILEAAESGEGVFMIGFMRRFDAAFGRAKERVAAGEIGRPLLVRSTGRGPGLPPDWAWDPDKSQGLIAEVNSHDLDTVRWLSGQEFQVAYALGVAAKRPDLAERFPDFVDLIIVSFRLTEGVLAQVDGACPAGYGYDARLEVYGSEGTVLVGGPVGPGPVLVREGEAVSDPVRSWRTLFADAYREEDRNFVAAALGEEAPGTSAEDGLRALEAAVAANRSMSEERPIDLEEVR